MLYWWDGNVSLLLTIGQSMVSAESWSSTVDCPTVDNPTQINCPTVGQSDNPGTDGPTLRLFRGWLSDCRTVGQLTVGCGTVDRRTVGPSTARSKSHGSHAYKGGLKCVLCNCLRRSQIFINVKKNTKEKFEHFCQEFTSPRKVYLDFDFPDTIFFGK